VIEDVGVVGDRRVGIDRANGRLVRGHRPMVAGRRLGPVRRGGPGSGRERWVQAAITRSRPRRFAR
jgi:hypothetical protein